MEDYLECKSRLFRQCTTGIINIDDPMAEIIAQVIQDSPNLKIKDSVEVLSFLEINFKIVFL